jgi:DNA-binding transcriptional LysR family regulator
MDQSDARRPLDTTALQYFEAAARLGSLTAASAELRTAVSAVSRKIKQLETEIGSPLFERVPRGLQLTGAGEVMLHHAKQGFEEFRRAREVIEELRGVRRGKVTVASVESPARGILMPALLAFWNEFQNVTADIAIVSSSDVARIIRQGDAELGLGFSNGASGGNIEVIAEMKLHIGAILPRGHSLAEARSVTLRDLATDPVLIADPTMLLHELVQMAADSEVFQPRLRLSSNSTGVLSSFAAAGAGVAFKTRLGLQDEIERGTIAFVPLSDAKLPMQHMKLWKRASQKLTPAASRLACLLKEKMREGSDETS